VQLNPDNAVSHFDLALALEQTGQLAEAMEQYEEALRIKPDFAAARNNLARLQALQKAAPANK
jgi:Flp pilus assembly protein TadD